MRNTELVYYKDRYLKEFTAEVLEVRSNGDLWEVVLDRTCFYPEGGGQPGDRGIIEESEVVDVRKKDGVVTHLLKGRPPGTGSSVRCRIDWPRRFDYMQQHTGQHVISAVLHKFGYGTVSVHQGESYTSIETDASHIPPEDLDIMEEEVNLLISRDIKVFDYTADDDEIAGLDLRRPPKVRNNIRIVEIEGVDRVACGGVHTASTGEVLFAKIVFTEKIRSHVRIAWKLGNRVLSDYRSKVKLVQDLSGLLSAPEKDIQSAVSRLIEENNSRKREVDFLKLDAARKDAAGILSSAETVNGVLFAVKEFDSDDSGFLKLLLSVFPEDKKYAVCFVNRSGDKFQWAAAVTAEEFDFNSVKKDLLAPIKGKGGGRKPFFQGVGSDFRGIAEFFETFKRIILSMQPGS